MPAQYLQPSSFSQLSLIPYSEELPDVSGHWYEIIVLDVWLVCLVWNHYA